MEGGSYGEIARLHQHFDALRTRRLALSVPIECAHPRDVWLIRPVRPEPIDALGEEASQLGLVALVVEEREEEERGGGGAVCAVSGAEGAEVFAEGREGQLNHARRACHVAPRRVW